MLVENIDVMLKALCALTEPFSKGSFYQSLRKLKRFKNDSSKESYFSLAKKLGLFEGPRGEHRRTVLGSEICRLIRKEAEEDVRQTMRNVFILKEPSFAQFLEFMKETRTRNEIAQWSNRVAGKVLPIWGGWLGLVQYSESRGCYFLTDEKQIPLSPEQFRATLWRAYEELSRMPLAGVRAAFVKIPQLRDRVFVMKRCPAREFDRQLRSLLSDPKYRNRIEISSAPITMMKRDVKAFKTEVFTYDDRKYHFIALKGGPNAEI